MFKHTSSYRRVTNSPACAGLAGYLKGSVMFTAAYGYQVYVMGASASRATCGRSASPRRI